MIFILIKIKLKLNIQMFIQFICISFVFKLSVDAQYVNNFMNRRVPCRNSLNGEIGECKTALNCPWIKWDLKKQRQYACFRNILSVGVCCPPKKTVVSMNLNDANQQKPIKINNNIFRPHINGHINNTPSYNFNKTSPNLYNLNKLNKEMRNKTTNYQTSSIHSNRTLLSFSPNKISQTQKPMITISISAYTPYMNTTTTSNSSLILPLNSTNDNLFNLNTLPQLNEALLNELTGLTISAIKKSYQSYDNKLSNKELTKHEENLNTIYMKVINDHNQNAISKQTTNSKLNECGTVNQQNYRIVGGHPALDGAWPWMSAIFLERQVNRSDYIFWCGGSLISDQFILTAAHCLTDLRGIKYSPNQIKVRLGSNWIERNQSDNLIKPPVNANQYQQEFGVEEIRIHNNFQRNGFLNDIALIKLNRKVEFNERIKCICLPKNKDKQTDFSGLLATVLGWGSLKYGGIGTNQLQQVTFPIWNNQDCDQRFVQKINQNFICAGYLTGMKDACQGDSGGSLQIPDENQIWRVQGIVSWGNKCAQPLYPGVYTRTSAYLDWILENIRD